MFSYGKQMDFHIVARKSHWLEFRVGSKHIWVISQCKGSLEGAGCRISATGSATSCVTRGEIKGGLALWFEQAPGTAPS